MLGAGLGACGNSGGGGASSGTSGASSVVPTALTSSLVASRMSGVAPLSVFFDASATTSPHTAFPFHEIKYAWSFGDPAGGATWTFGTRPGQISKNTAHGPIAGHVFETPGVYTVALTAFDGANTSSKTTTITVTDPNAVFNGTNTICVASGTLPVGGANGCPTGAGVHNLATLPAVTALATGGKRILLKRGDTWSVSGVSYIGNSNVIFGAYGSGATPKILFTTDNYGFAIANNVSNLVFMDLDFDGGVPITTINKRAFAGGTANNNITILRATGTGVADAAMLSGDNLFIVDSNFSNFAGGSGNVGIWVADSTRLAIMGTRIFDASHIEHNIRTQGASKAVYSNNTIAGPALTKQGLTIRGNAGWTEQVVVSDNDISGGPAGAGQLVQFAPQNTASYERIRDVIFERNYVWGDVGTGVGSEVCDRATIRNNIFSLNGASGSAHGIDIVFANTVGVPPSSSHFVYNNSFYYAGTLGFNAVNAFSLNGVYPSGTLVKNNLAYAPGATNDGFNNGTQGRLYAGNAPGSNYVLVNNSSDLQVRLSPGLSTTPPTASLTSWKPVAGSYAIGTGLPVPVLPVWDDFFFISRIGSQDMGAVLH